MTILYGPHTQVRRPQNIDFHSPLPIQIKISDDVSTNMRNTRQTERRLGDIIRANLPPMLAECVMFVLKQGWSALFGILLLCAIIGSRLIWNDHWAIARYDALVIFAISTQIAFLYFKLETWEEARVILLFHLTGTAMEIFKIYAGSWAYPGDGVLKIMQVPLFSGFMYAAVGSYMARVIRVFEMRFTPFPPFHWHLFLAALIYVNFFAHHYLPDIRMVLFAATILLYARTRIWFRMGTQSRFWWMPLPLAAFFSSFFLWLAENIGTLTKTWVYAGQTDGQAVSFAKMGSWYLLLYVSFATVTFVTRDAIYRQKCAP